MRWWLALAALMLGFTSPAWADDWTACVNFTSFTTDAEVDAQIAACSRIINSGTNTGDDLALAYFSRGMGYYNKGDYDRAIADYDKSIRLKPDDAGPSFGHHGRVDRGKRRSCNGLIFGGYS